jgi:hypothetical protein
MRSFLCLGFVVFASGCCATYKDALCKLSQGSQGVSKHYAEYVANEPDPATKTARQAEATQFSAAVQEAANTCAGK